MAMKIEINIKGINDCCVFDGDGWQLQRQHDSNSDERSCFDFSSVSTDTYCPKTKIDNV